MPSKAEAAQTLQKQKPALRQLLRAFAHNANNNCERGVLQNQHRGGCVRGPAPARRFDRFCGGQGAAPLGASYGNVLRAPVIYFGFIAR
eukprot:5948354-Lingulodinium_polyedra.AAC.1